VEREKEREISIRVIIVLLLCYYYNPHFCYRFAQLIGDMFSLTLTIQLALNTIMISITLLQVCVYSFQDSIQHVFFTHDI